MKYTKSERMDIGRRIFNKELTVAEAADEYDVNLYTARDYLRSYKAVYLIKPMLLGEEGTDAGAGVLREDALPADAEKAGAPDQRKPMLLGEEGTDAGAGVLREDALPADAEKADAPDQKKRLAGGKADAPKEG